MRAVDTADVRPAGTTGLPLRWRGGRNGAAYGDARRWLLPAPAALVFVGLFVAPLAYFFILSFWTKKAMRVVPEFTVSNYIVAWEKYSGVMAATLGIAFATAVLTTLIAFALAYLIRF